MEFIYELEGLMKMKILYPVKDPTMGKNRELYMHGKRHYAQKARVNSKLNSS